MAKTFDVIYPAKERQGLDGGLNSKFSVHLIGANESPDCANVIFSNGAVETRGGTSKLNTTSVGTFVGMGLYTRHDNSGAESMCAFWNGTLYVWDGSNFVSITSSASLFTVGTRIGADEYENYMFFGNGGISPYKYSNGGFTRHGTPAPTQTMTVATTTAGTLTGAYVYKVTYVNSALVESDLSPATATWTAANEYPKVNSIPTGPASYGVLRRYLYRTSAGGSTFFRVATINDNTTSFTTDTVADNALGAAAPTDQGVPPKYSWIVTHANRLFCNDSANPNYVWYSELSNPYVFKAANFIRIGDNTTDIARAGAIYDNNLVVFGDRSIYVIYMPDTTPSNWSIVKTRSSYGSKSPFGIFSYNNKLMFPALQSGRISGFAALSGDTVDPDATLLTVSIAGSELKSERIEPECFTFQETYASRISSYVYRNKAYITVTTGDGNTSNNKMYVYDFSISNLKKKTEGVWVPWTGLHGEQFTVYSGKLYYQSSDAVGRVYEMNTTTYNDDGTAIDSYFWTKEFSGNPGDEQILKDFRFTNIMYQKPGNYFMSFLYRVDSDLGGGDTKNIDLSPGASVWGTMQWGVDTWGGGQDVGEDLLYFGQLRGKRLQMKFTNQNTVNQKFKVVSMQFTYNLKGRR